MEKKYVIFGGFDYPVYWEMNHDSIYKGIDYFVDNDPKLIGSSYMGKMIYSPEKLLEEDKDSITIFIGSIIHHLEIEIQLMDMGFEKDIHFQWAISFCGDEKCPRLWHHIEWSDRQRNSASLGGVEQGEFWLERLKIVARLIDYDKNDTVVDLGAANGRIAELLPENMKYIPVDYMKYSEDTRVCDFNEYEFPIIENAPEKTCVIMIATIQYVRDWKWILRQISRVCTTFICAHHDFVRINREYRRTNFNNNNAVFNHEIILEMQKLGFRMIEAYDYQLRCVIMKFVKE